MGQRNAGRVLLLATEDTASFRGFFRLLSEQHIPFVGLGEPPLDGRPVAPVRPCDRARAGPSGTRTYVRDGGRVLVAGTTPPSIPIGSVVGRRTTQGYWRVHDHDQLPSLRDTNLIFIDGEYVELAPIERPLLTLIPAAMFGPPEKVWSDKVETKVPGLVFADHGKGRVAYIPWNVGALYYRHSSQGHAGLMTDVIDRLLPAADSSDRRASARRDDAHGSAGASPDADAPRQRHWPPGHWLLPAGGVAEHPNRALP